MSSNVLFKRKFSLILTNDTEALDLSTLHCTFRTEQADFETPNNAHVRVYNLSSKTQERVKEFSRLVLQAGYEGGPFGVIFDGTIKQFGFGRESAKDTYLDLFAADGDLAYNFAVVNRTLSPGASQSEQLQAALDAMGNYGVYLGYKQGDAGVTLPRGKTAFAMGRDVIRQYADTNKSSWSIQKGAIQIIPLDSFKPGEVMDINAGAGLIGQPQQTAAGVKFKNLLDPRFTVGQAIRINNKDINQIIQSDPAAAPIAYNSRTQALSLAKVRTDGLYRLLEAEFEGDTRGQPWYANCVALAIDPSSNKVNPYG